MIQRSDDGGKTWEPVGNKFVYDGVPGTHQWYDGTPHPWEFKRVWHLEPSLTDPDTVYAGVEDAALFRSTDGGTDLARAVRAARPRLGPALAAGRRRHVPAHDPARSDAIPSGSSSPSRPPARSAPTTAAQTWQPINHGLQSAVHPRPDAEVGHCVHRIAMHPSRPDVLFMQKHWDVMRSDDAGESWHEVSGNLPTDFGFAIDVHAHEPETIYVVPIKSDSEHYPPEGKLRVYRSRTGGNEWEALTNGLPQSDCYVNVLRDAMAVDSLDRAASTSAPPAARSTPRPTPATTGRRSSAICRPCCRSRCRRCHDPRRAARTSADAGAASSGEVQLDVEGPVTQRSVLDALEARYPMLRGTIRDHVTQQRRAVRAVLRLRGGSVPRAAGRAAARRGRDGRRAVSGRRRDGRRLTTTPSRAPIGELVPELPATGVEPRLVAKPCTGSRTV